MKTIDAERSAAPAASMQTRHNPNAADAEDEEELPLLFMDELPSNFQQNAQLAAIATFMADSADEAADDDDDEAGNGSKQRRQRHHTFSRTRRRRQPYAKLLLEPKNKKNRDEPKIFDTRELQLFLSMFHVS